LTMHSAVRRLMPRHSMLLLLAISFALLSNSSAQAETWAEKLGYPAGKKVLILHADDIGMCYEANVAAKAMLTPNKDGRAQIQSAALMVPCPWYNEMADWYKQNPDHDIGLHLALTSEWKWYRWGPVADRAKVPGLIDNEGYLFRSVPSVVLSAKPSEIETEIRAQIDRAIAKGTRPSHIDTHMGTLFARPDYTQVYLKVAEEYRIPAMAIEPSDKVMAKFKKQGYPVSERGNQILREYKLPKLDDFWAAPDGKTYEEKKANFIALVRSFDPGINEIIFHPSVETECLKAITGSWQQRVWESQMFGDPELLAYFERDGILFTNWKEIMKRWEAKFGDTLPKKDAQK